MAHNDPFSVQGKIIIITGGSGFLGAEYVRSLREAGATVVVWDLEAPEPVDITDEAAVAAATERVLVQFGRIDTLINNAAMAAAVGDPDAGKQFVPYEEYPLSLWEKELRVNLTGMFLATRAVARIMMERGAGSIINVASEVSIIAHDHRVYGDPAQARFKSIAYTTTKTAVVGFTRQWAARLGRHGVRVNAFSPGGVRAPAHPEDFAKRFGESNMFGRMARPDEYNGIIRFLCSDASSFMTGHNLVADGGKSAW